MTLSVWIVLVEMDLPPKYEDVIANSSPVAYNSNQVSSDPVRVVWISN